MFTASIAMLIYEVTYEPISAAAFTNPVFYHDSALKLGVGVIFAHSTMIDIWSNTSVYVYLLWRYKVATWRMICDFLSENLITDLLYYSLVHL